MVQNASNRSRVTACSKRELLLKHIELLAKHIIEIMLENTNRTLTSAAARLRLYNTATHNTSEFTTVTPGHVGMYVCGATVQSSPHIGHIRAAIAFDIVRRWLLRLGYSVTFVRNVTDIDDKIIKKASENGQTWWQRAYIYEREFTKAYDTLGVMPPTVEPRATGHINDMVELIQRLIDRGHAYAITDTNSNPTGNVYFSVPSWQDYGALTHQNGNSDGSNSDDKSSKADKYNPIDPADASPDKHDARDFALWKAPCDFDQKDARWKTPFGEGRPGWHIECSAMSHRYLGDSFDIHGGGLDLRFPHHENEMAQTLAAGWKSANVWMHSAWVTSKGEKMSKSLGNGLSVSSVLAQKSAWVVRYALGGVQYRAMLEWSDQSLNEAQSAYDRISNFLERAGRVIENQPDYAEVQSVDADNLPEDFTKAMNDDINVSGALAAIFTAIRSGNALLDDYAQSQDNSQNDGIKNLIKTCVLQVRAMLDTIGLDPYSPQWRSNAQKSQDLGTDANDGASAEHKALESLIANQLEQRAIARAAKDFARADAIRDSLTAAGVVIEDCAQGSSWHLS